MIALLYFVVALLMIGALHRWVRPLTRGAALALLLLPLCFTGRAVLTGSVYAPIDLTYLAPPLSGLKEEMGIGAPRNALLSDLYSQIMPWRQAVRTAVTNGEWPLWNASILSGDILAAAAQPAAFSPFTLVALLLPVPQSFTLTAALMFLVAALGAFAFCREDGCREATAIIGAAGWMFSTSISFFILWPIGAAWALLPLVMLAARRVALVPSWRSASLLTASFTLLLLAGHPETALHVVTIAAAYGVFHLVNGARTSTSAVAGSPDLATHTLVEVGQKKPSDVDVLRLRTWRSALPFALRSVAAAFAAGLVALLLCAIYLLPLLEAVPQTSEHEFRTNYWAVAKERGQPLVSSAARIATDVLPPLHLRKWAEKAIFVPVDTAAVGSLVLAAAIFALWRVRSGETWFLAGLLAFGLLARAEPPWLEHLFQKIPLYDVALNARFSFAAAFALAVLGALGIEAASESPRAFGVNCLAVLIVLVALTAALLRPEFVTSRPYPWQQFTVAAEVIALAGAVLISLFPATRRNAPLFIASFLALLLLQRTVEQAGAIPTIAARAAYPPIPLLESIDRSTGPFRIAGLGGAFPPGTCAFYGLEDVRGYEAMTLARYAETYPFWCRLQPIWFNRVEDLSRPFLSFLNVRYAITADSDAVPEGWRELRTDHGARLLENTRLIARAFVPRTVRLGISEEDELREMAAETDFNEHAWIRASLEKHQRDNGPGKVTIDRRRSDYFLNAEMQRSGWIVVSESAWKGWRAYLDGHRVQMQIANHAFLSVYVPEGKHSIRLTYLPESFVIGRGISIATLLGIVVLGLWRRTRRSWVVAIRPPA